APLPEILLLVTTKPTPSSFLHTPIYVTHTPNTKIFNTENTEKNEKTGEADSYYHSTKAPGARIGPPPPFFSVFSVLSFFLPRTIHASHNTSQYDVLYRPGTIKHFRARNRLTAF